MKKVIVLPVVLALTLSGCARPEETGATKAKPPTTSDKAKPNTKKAKPTTYKSGVYEVGKEIKAGKYKTRGPNKDDVIPQCVWSRLKGLGGELNDIIANGIVEGPATIVVKKSDKAIKFDGSCKWELSK